jgi:hypothetical protein
LSEITPRLDEKKSDTFSHIFYEQQLDSHIFRHTHIILLSSFDHDFGDPGDSTFISWQDPNSGDKFHPSQCSKPSVILNYTG